MKIENNYRVFNKVTGITLKWFDVYQDAENFIAVKNDQNLDIKRMVFY